ncbi:MAG: helix-turn-helix transcriptional regulator [Anaerolineae bacterium]
MSDLSSRLLLSRRELDLNQDELARRVGVDRSYISQIERGVVTNVGVEVLMKVADALKISLAYLLGLTDAPLGNANDGSPIEASADRLIFEVRDAEMRRAIIELIAILREMTPAQMRAFVEMGQKMQKLLESGNDKAPIIIGG